MTFEQKIAWAGKRDLSVRLFNIIERTWFFNTDCGLIAQLDLLAEIRQGLIRHIGKKCLREWQEVIAQTLSEKAGYNKIKTFTEYANDGFTEQEIPLIKRYDVLFNLYKIGHITEEEHEELLQLITALKI